MLQTARHPGPGPCDGGHGATPASQLHSRIAISLLTGGFDKPYVLGLARALTSRGILVEVIGSDQLDGAEMRCSPGLTFRNLHGSQRQGRSTIEKLLGTAALYIRLLRYAAAARPKVFHILWNNKAQYFDRTALTLYYKLLGKRVVLTAHNVNAGKRDGNDSTLNRLTLKMQYAMADGIFVHTEKMKAQLVSEFGIRADKVTIIPFGINNTVPDTDLTVGEAKRRLGVAEDERTILFFGNIGPYKGLEHLVAAFQRIAVEDTTYRLLIVGKTRGGAEAYLNGILEQIQRDPSRDRVIIRIEYVPDEETEVYFKAADVLVLPYTEVFQSGVLVLGYNFGLPVIASDVGSLRNDIAEGATGYLCRPSDPADLAGAIKTYFASDLYKNLNRCQQIKDYARARFSWEVVGETTERVCEELLGGDG